MTYFYDFFILILLLWYNLQHLKSALSCTFFNNNKFRKDGNIYTVYIYFYLFIYSCIYLFSLNKTDTYLYFLTLEKVAVSLPTKCLSDPTSGSVFIGNYKLGPAPSREVGDTNHKLLLLF